ncbi:MAG: hypothetical protein LBU08_02015 [Tannerellaceae bacterium]|nr:hypothetical protein [Tannerellaceae bacterium]
MGTQGTRKVSGEKKAAILDKHSSRISISTMPKHNIFEMQVFNVHGVHRIICVPEVEGTNRCGTTTQDYAITKYSKDSVINVFFGQVICQINGTSFQYLGKADSVSACSGSKDHPEGACPAVLGGGDGVYGGGKGECKEKEEKCAILRTSLL